MRLEQLAFFASVLVGLEVAVVLLALAVAHSLVVADVKTVSSQNSVGHLDSGQCYTVEEASLSLVRP